MNKKEAAALLGVSERAVNRYIIRGRLSVTYRKRERGSQEAVFDPDEVAALKTYIDTPRPAKSKALTVRDKDDKLTTVKGDQLRALVSILETSPRPVPIESKLTLTLREASKLSGLSRAFLLQAIKRRKLKAAKRGRGWNIIRRDLDSWIATKI